MKRIWLLLFLIAASCRQEQSVDFISLIPFAEGKPDTEVLLFASPKTEQFLFSWSQPKRQLGGRYRWSQSDSPSLSWTHALTVPSFLHLRATATESFPMDVHLSGQTSSRYLVDSSRTVQTIKLKENVTRAEFKLPAKARFGIHSAVITPSRYVAEFRKPAPFPFVEKIQWKGKKRNALFCETGGSISFHEIITPESVLEFGYYFDPSHQYANDSAIFSIFLIDSDGKEKRIFQRMVNQTLFENARVPLRSFVSNEQRWKPSRLEFRIARDTAFGDGKSAWVEPKLWRPATAKRNHIRDSSTLRDSMKGANVLLIILDAASIRRFGLYGYARDTTPEIDELGKEGVQFMRAYTNAVYTLASSATTLTGQLPLRHGILQHRNRLPSAAITLPEKLQQGGFDTAAFLANGNVSTAFGLTQGFRTLREVFRERNYVGRAEDITSTFVEWLAARQNSQFFAYLHYREPHDPYQPPLPWVKKFTDPSYKGPVLDHFLQKKPIEENDPTFTEADRKFISSLYDANLAYGDSQVGKVLRLLKDAKIYDRTMVVVTSDHGEAFWEHGYQGHNLQLYEESARVPMIIKFPRRTGLEGKKISFPVQHADLYPTLVDLFGISTRAMRTDGISLVPWLTGKVPPEREILIQSTRRLTNALVFGDYKYVQNKDNTAEVYNLKIDPLERLNLIDSERVHAGYLRQLLLKKLSSARPDNGIVEAAELDDASRENLKALGYLD